MAYFSLEDGADAVLGSSDYASTYGKKGDEYTFYFSTAENKALFDVSSLIVLSVSLTSLID